MLNTQADDNFSQIKSVNKKQSGRASTIRQLNIWIKNETKAALVQQAKLEHRSMATIVEELIQQYTSQQQADVVERQSLPLIREVIVTEIRKALAQHRLDLSEDMRIVVLDAIKLYIHQSVEQLARIVGRAVRVGMINRRLIHALMSRAYGEEFASQADEEAAGDTGKQVPSRSPIKEG
ncbi:MAG: hypothetical protein M3Z24_16270 [Chloroflexota bacterium]|nr:hypothetical protein [Chloroflexota bacterium]